MIWDGQALKPLPGVGWSRTGDGTGIPGSHTASPQEAAFLMLKSLLRGGPLTCCAVMGQDKSPSHPPWPSPQLLPTQPRSGQAAVHGETTQLVMHMNNRLRGRHLRLKHPQTSPGLSKDPPEHMCRHRHKPSSRRLARKGPVPRAKPGTKGKVVLVHFCLLKVIQRKK